MSTDFWIFRIVIVLLGAYRILTYLAGMPANNLRSPTTERVEYAAYLCSYLASITVIRLFRLSGNLCRIRNLICLKHFYG